MWFVCRLRGKGVPVRLVTNETQVTVQRSVDKLLALGYTGLSSKDIFAPAPAIAQHVRENKLRPYLLVHPNVN